MDHALFEVSFEVCNKVGGIYTVLSTKAPTLTKQFGDDYICIGPWLLRDEEHPVPFEREAGFEEFEEQCRAIGLPVQVGRWKILGSPRTVLVEFSSLYERKDAILAGLWEHYQVDSIEGDWDYVEPVLFGYAAGQIIERWWDEFHAPNHKRAVAQFHEWMTGSGLLYLKRSCPGIGTVFTTHATMLGRALSSLGRSPADGLGDDTAEGLARDNGVVAKHSLEGVCAREADVFTPVSEIPAAEAELLHERKPVPVLPNGIDLDAIDSMAGDVDREEARRRLRTITETFLGEDISDAAFLGISGRYEFHNKGIDLLLDSLSDINGRVGRRVVLFVLVPAGNSGLRSELREREGASLDSLDGPLGISTHNLFDPAGDPVQQRCATLGLENQPGSRVKVVQVPIYLSEHDDFLQLPYEAVLRALDLTCFPSYYEPWGYTPQESLAVGVPTITTDYAGFGRWALGEQLGREHGIEVLPRERIPYPEVRKTLTKALSLFLQESPPGDIGETCRTTARKTAWSDLIENYDQAQRAALEAVQERLEKGLPLRRRPKRALPVSGESPAPRLTRFDVSATLPPELAPLAALAKNYAWCWDPDAEDLFRELSPAAWESCKHNPVTFLRHAYRQDIESKVKDKAYLERLAKVDQRVRAQLDAAPDTDRFDPEAISPEHPVAYFSAEFGIHESLRIYSGGLGVLAGDHLKAASDIRLPMVGVGLFYRMGYMTQRLTAEGDQHSIDVENVPADMAVTPVRDDSGNPLEIILKLPSRELVLRAWQAEVGRVTLYLLDANIPANREEDRDITRNLYGGDETTRIRQEIVLGRGGARLLYRLGIQPGVWHMNEGHAAFLSLERVSRLVRDEGLTFEEAREMVRGTTAFTTHTPVPAGHDRFSEDLMRTYFSDVADWLGVPWERFIELGRSEANQGDFNMTVLALEFASFVNGVSKLHGSVSQQLLKTSWPGLLESEVPVTSVTNGIHLGSWVSPAISRLVSTDERAASGRDFTDRAAGIDLAELHAARTQAKQVMLAKLRGRFEQAFYARHDSPVLLNRMLEGMREDALWIGFARRFAPYKRAGLILTDPDRLRAILDNEERPVRLVIAGKAHPRDQLGKDVLREIASLSRSDEFAGRLFVAEDYDIDLARALVQGVDVWLNTPTRTLEASGTSGMKAAANGSLNVSIADGWWPEGADERNGWTIGGMERTYESQELQNQLDTQTLYGLLEDEVVPLFFDRNAAGLPEGWLERSRHALETLPPVFDTARMVGEYAAKAYVPLAREGVELASQRRDGARTRAHRKARLRQLFPKIHVTDAHIADLDNVRVGDSVDVRLVLDLGELTPEDVAVELVLGHAKDGDIEDLAGAVAVPLERTETGEDGRHVYEGGHRVERSGTYAYGLRIRASDEVGDPVDVLRDLVHWVG